RRARVDADEQRRGRGAAAPQLPARELRGAEEVHVDRRFPGLHALNRKILAEQALLRRLVAEQEERRGARDPSLEPIVEDLDSGLRARRRGARRGLHHGRTTASGSCTNGCQAASTW